MTATGHRHPANQRRHDRRTRAERLADTVTGVFGSWRFIIVQTVAVATWIGVNQLALTYLIAWHRDAHGADCRCVEEIGTYAEATLRDLGHSLSGQPDAPPLAATEAAPAPARTA